MNVPAFSAEASLYKTSTHYYLATAWASTADIRLAVSQLGLPGPLPHVGIICNGSCPPVCHIHCRPCALDPTSSTGCSRTCTATGPGCDDPGTFTSECPANSPGCCPTTCTPCTGGSCGTYPQCSPVPLSGTQTCTDCHGNVTHPRC